MQLPQWFGSVEVSAQVVPQTAFPAGQLHWPLTHEWPLGHAVSQVPQWFGSVDRSTQTAPQFTLPARQAHTPALQTAPVAQWLPHAPQLSVSVCSSTHPMTSPQSVWPAAQAHTPLVQASLQQAPGLLRSQGVPFGSQHEGGPPITLAQVPLQHTLGSLKHREKRFEGRHIATHMPWSQTSPASHPPQSRVPPQPSETVPQVPGAHDAAGVQHTPNLSPGALTQSPLFPLVPQQLRLWWQTAPSPLQGPAVAGPSAASIRPTVPRRRSAARPATVRVNDFGYDMATSRQETHASPAPLSREKCLPERAFD